MNILIFIFLLSAFFLDIILTGIYTSQYFYFLYLATAYYLTFYTPSILSSTWILMFNALYSFFITSIFGLWIVHAVPTMVLSQLSKKYVKNNYVLFGSTFLFFILGDYLVYGLYLHTTLHVYTIGVQLMYNTCLFILACITHYFMIEN